MNLKVLMAYFDNRKPRVFWGSVNKAYKRFLITLLKKKRYVDGVQEYAFLSEEEYEYRWQLIKQKYAKIILKKIRVDSIGELLPRFFVFEEEKKDDSLYVLLPWCDKNRVASLFAMEYCGICNKGDTLFWLYVINNHSDELILSEIDDLLRRHESGVFLKEAYSIIPRFSSDEIENGEQQLKKLRIDMEYVCVFCRSKEYDLDSYNSLNFERDLLYSDFKTYGSAIAYLRENQLISVRMGYEKEKCEVGTDYVDYASSEVRSSFMDFYLFSKCRFAILSMGGIMGIPMMFSIPILYTNAIQISYGYGGCRYTEFDIFVPRRFYNTEEKRFISFREMFEYEKDIPQQSRKYYESKHILVYENTAEDICEAVDELIKRINGTWNDSKEELDFLNRYKEFCVEMRRYQEENPRNWCGGPLPALPAISFVRKNMYLVEGL